MALRPRARMTSLFSTRECHRNGHSPAPVCAMEGIPREQGATRVRSLWMEHPSETIERGLRSASKLADGGGAPTRDRPRRRVHRRWRVWARPGASLLLIGGAPSPDTEDGVHTHR